ncbi:MAG: HAD-IC family P-type ATPase [Clostridia bacterium]|nr:HAD-IC family P-type ATPase [Clostridia bacterium]
MEEVIDNKSELGLSDIEVEERKKDGRVNGDQDIKTKSVGKILFTNIFTLFNIIFLAIAAILLVTLFTTKKSGYTISDFSDFGFLGVLLANTLIGIIQELRAKKTIDKLSLLSTPKVTVIRNGKEKEIMLKDIVMDDIMVLSAGRQICADSVVVDGFIEVNESLITGEPDAISKNPGDELLSGSFVVSGTAKVKVIRVGKDNYATKISIGAKYIKDYPSEIRRVLLKFIRFMGIILVPLGAALFCVKHFFQGNEMVATIKSVMGNLIGMIPSGLVTLTSAIFCVSVVRLSKYNALAQDLYCVETLARVDTLCLDKTGTLTEGTMLVEDIIAKKENENIESILHSIVEYNKDNNVTAQAIIEKVNDSPMIENIIEGIPFSSKYKFSGIKVKDSYYVFGAPEFVLKDKISLISEEIEEYTKKGMRVLALIKTETIDNYVITGDVELIGLVIISDKIREEAKETLKFFDEQGVNIKIISGDNPVTVSKIAERTGVKNYDKYIDASTLKTEEDLRDAAEKYTVFGRTTPDQKLSLVKILKSNGHTVAMTGDGVNDVLALRESDCSIAMASGSDAAKNVGQLVLLDNNFASLPKAVAEGRRTINNLERSAALFFVKTLYNLLFAIIFMIISFKLPFDPKHMTFIGTVTIGIPSVILALEPNKELVKGSFFRKVISQSLPTAVTIVVSIVTISAVSKIYGNLTDGQIATVCVVVAGIIGFLHIIKISWPLNWLRIGLLVILILLFVGAFFADFGKISVTRFFGLERDFNTFMWILIGTVGGGSIPLFAGLTFLSNYIFKILPPYSEIKKKLFHKKKIAN